MAADGSAASRNSIQDPTLRDNLINPNGSCDLGSIRSASNLSNILDFGDPVPRLTKKGRCDPNNWSLRQSCERWRYSRGLFTLNYDLASNTYRIGASTTLSLFTAGVGDQASAEGWPAGTMSEVETDAFKSGAMADNLQLFQVRSLGIGIGIPFVLGNKFGNAPWTKRYALSVFNNGFLGILQAGILENFSVTASYPQASPAYNLGPLSAWTPHANTQLIGASATTGWQFGAGSIVPIDGELGGGSQDARSQLSILLKSSDSYNIEFENPIAQNPPAQIYVPALAFGYGYQSADCSSVEQCGVITEDQVLPVMQRVMAQQMGITVDQVRQFLAAVKANAGRLPG